MITQNFSIDNYSGIFPVTTDSINHNQSICYKHCPGSADAFLICSMFSKGNRSFFIFMPESKQADTFARECSSLVGEDNVLLYPSRDAVPYNMKSPFGPTVETRFNTLSHLIDGEKKIYIGPSVILLQKTPPPMELFNRIIRLHTNDEISQETLSLWLTENGFIRETIVADLGTFAIRGCIFDIYPLITENPIRIEFWGNTIESIREFDVFSQKSQRMRSSVEIFPMKEFTISEQQIEQGLMKIQEYCLNSKNDMQKVHKIRQKWKSLSDCDGIEWFLHWFDLPWATILDYLPPDCTVIWNDILSLNQRIHKYIDNYNIHLNRVPDIFFPFISKPDKLLVPVKQIKDDISTFNPIFINTHTVPENCVSYNLALQEQPSFDSNLKLLINDLLIKEADGYSVTILCENLGHAERLSEQLKNECFTLNISIGYIEQGFIDQQHKIAVYSENQIFHRSYHRPIKIKKTKNGVPIPNYDALQPGDYVVHIDHGISRFSRIERIKTGNIHQDCMVLLFQNNAKVYVPIVDFHKVQKYIGKDSTEPILSKLGTSRWEKIKERTKESLREMAQQLISLYAKRTCLKGISFSKDSIWQKEFEDAFIYEPTPDQIKAIDEVKKDMETEKPMDRLICGDVGFGKTEIAMRAAFKAATDGYQVAVLTPTTILASQHFTTFKERMADFPINIAVLSRFLKAKEQKTLLKKIKNSNIDIIIGTHRILSNDVEFKNLGLLIVDEEQRFGVRHKVKLKEYRYKVDVLSMTATPIPRTMHLSLTGIRDLSIINTPPRDRLPIETQVSEYHDEIIKNSIENELDRGGQIYIVHNRIRNLNQIRDSIEVMIPNARIKIAHGQMDEDELDSIMKKFIAGKFDILLSTAIVESGLDIPNVNTIIVNRADSFGLSQLYQLRGRVGRSSEQAFAYFLTPSFKNIKEASLKRLHALEQYTELGSGFQIAMRDLEIRGAGNILGTHQHGYIAAVGFELYCRLLKGEVDRIMGRNPDQNDIQVKIDLKLDAYIPAEYIPDSTTRIEIYQECSSFKNSDEIENIKHVLIDRFGPIPEPVHSLLLLTNIKILAQQTGISHITVNSDNLLSLSFNSKDEDIAQKLKGIVASSSRAFDVSYSRQTVLKTSLVSKNSLSRAIEIVNILTKQIENLEN